MPEGEPLDDAAGWILGAPLDPQGPVTRYRAAAPRSDDDPHEKRGIVLLVSDRSLDARLAERTRLLARTRHAGLQEVVAIGESHGRPFRVDPLPTGATLTARLRAGKHVDDRATRTIGLVVADALGALHRFGLAHGHVCPDTVVLARTPGGRAPLVVDVPALEAGPWLPYVAPEVVTGQPPGPASDVFGLGVVLATLRARRPLEPDDGALAWSAVPSGPCLVVAGGSDDDLTRLIQDMVDRDPTRRPASMATVMARLRGESPAEAVAAGAEAEEDEEVEEGPTLLAPEPPPPRRGGWGLPLGIGAAAVVAGLVLARFLFPPPQPPTADVLALSAPPAAAPAAAVEPPPPPPEPVAVVPPPAPVAADAPAAPSRRSEAPTRAATAGPRPVAAALPPPPSGAWSGTVDGAATQATLEFGENGVVRVERAGAPPLVGRYRSAPGGKATVVLREVGGASPATWSGAVEDGALTGDVQVGGRTTGRFQLTPADGG